MQGYGAYIAGSNKWFSRLNWQHNLAMSLYKVINFLEVERMDWEGFQNVDTSLPTST